MKLQANIIIKVEYWKVEKEPGSSDRRDTFKTEESKLYRSKDYLAQSTVGWRARLQVASWLGKATGGQLGRATRR